MPTADTLESDPSGVKSFISDLGEFGPAADAAAAAAAAAPPPPPAPAQKPPEPPASAPTPPAKASAAVESDENPPKDQTDWEKFKSSRKQSEEKLKGEISTHLSKVKEYEAKIAEYEKKIAEMPVQTPEERAKVDELAKENERLSETVRRLNVTEHPQFKQYFNTQIERQVTLAKNIVGADKAADVERLLKMPDSEYRQQKLEEFVADLTPTQSTRIGGVLNKLEEIATEREDAVKTELARVTALQAKEADERKSSSERAAKELTELFANTLKSLQDPENGHPAFQQREGDEAWNAGVVQRIEAAKGFLMGKGYKPADIAKAAFEAAAYPAMLENQKRLYAENETLRKQVASMQAASPRPAGAPGGSPGGEGEKQNIKPGMSGMEAGAAFAKSLQADWSP